MVFGQTSAAFEQLQLQQAQQLACVPDPNNSLEPNNSVSINSLQFKLHLDPVGLSIGSETQQPDPQRIELLQWLQVSDPNSNRVAVMDTKASTVSATQATESSLASIAVTPTPHEIEDSYAVVTKAAQTGFRRMKKPTSAPKQVPKEAKPPPKTPKLIKSTSSKTTSKQSDKAASKHKEKAPHTHYFF